MEANSIEMSMNKSMGFNFPKKVGKELEDAQEKDFLICFRKGLRNNPEANNGRTYLLE